MDLGALLGIQGIGAIYTTDGNFCFQPVGNESGLRPYVRRASLANSHWYLQHLISWLAKGGDTGGALTLMELSGRSGLEPPPHVHTREDELYFLLDGALSFVVGEEVHHLREGDGILLPRGIRHHYQSRTQQWRALVAMTPSGLESYYMEFARPAKALELPRPEEDPLDFGAIVPRLVELGERYGVWYPPARRAAAP